MKTKLYPIPGKKEGRLIEHVGSDAAKVAIMNRVSWGEFYSVQVTIQVQDTIQVTIQVQDTIQVTIQVQDTIQVPRRHPSTVPAGILRWFPQASFGGSRRHPSVVPAGILRWFPQASFGGSRRNPSVVPAGILQRSPQAKQPIQAHSTNKSQNQ